MKELWKTIEDFEDYQISNYGRVKSLKYNKEKILKPCVTKQGYLRIELNQNDLRKKFFIHCLLLKTFFHNNTNLEVNHLDGNKLNNNIDNLKWCTRSENEKHAHRTGLKNFKGERNNANKLLDEDVLVIYGLSLSGMSQIEIGKLYKVTSQHISKIVNGKSRTYLIGE